MAVYGLRRPLELPRFPPANGAASKAAAERKAYFPEAGGYVDVPVYAREALGAGAGIGGPAIVEESGSTTVLPPGTRAIMDDYGNLLVEVL